MIQKYDSKPFIKISTPIYFSILNANILPSPYLSTWLFVYCFDPSGMKGKPIAYSTIASNLNVSHRTVVRNIEYLVRNGFMKKRPFKKGGLGINILQCIIPKHLQEKCDQYKDRRKSKVNQEHEYPMIPQLFQEEYKNKSENEQELEEKSKDDKEKNLPKDENVLFNKKNINININIHNVEKDCEVFPDSEQQSLRDEISCKENELLSITEHFKSAEKEFLEALKSPEPIPNITFELLQKKNRISCNIDIIQSRIKFLQKRIDDGIAMSEIREKVKVDQEVVNNIPGKRKMSEGLLWWIKKKLRHYGINPSFVPGLLNEIVHSVRFGSFSIVKYSNCREEMPLMRSVNCCLKLIREGRWQSPASYQYGNIYA